MRDRIKIVLAAAVCLMLLTIGISAGRYNKRGAEQTPLATQNTPQPVITAEQLSSTERGSKRAVEIVYEFSCGHTVSHDATEVAEGIDTAALAAAYGAHSCKEAPGRLTLYVAIGNACPEHFWIEKDEAGAAVFKTDANSMEKAKVCELGGEWNEYGDDMPEYFDSLEAINLYLEGVDE